MDDERELKESLLGDVDSRRTKGAFEEPANGNEFSERDLEELNALKESVAKLSSEVGCVQFSIRILIDFRGHTLESSTI